MTKLEKKLAAQLLEIASDEFGNHGCNDFPMPNTDENWALMVRMEEDNVGLPWEQIPDEDKAKRPPLDRDIYFQDSWLMSYLSRMLEKEAESQS